MYRISWKPVSGLGVLAWVVSAALGVAALAGAYAYFGSRPEAPTPAPAEVVKTPGPEAAPPARGDRAPTDASIRLSRAQQEAIGLRTARAETGTTVDLIRAPGRVTPDETKFAHITSRAPGVVRSVAAQIGQEVETGDLLATLDSPEVAQARSDYLARSLELEIAKTRADWQAAITAGTLELIERLKQGDSPDQIEERFQGRAVGANRESLLTAYSRLRVARAAQERNRDLLASKAVSLAQYQVVAAENEAATAAYESLMDRLGTETRLANTTAEQQHRQAEIAVRVARGRLRALGVPTDIEPLLQLQTAPTPSPPGSEANATEAPTMGLYELRAPFDGTVLDREMIVPGVPIDTARWIFLLADLDTVWIEAHVHEGDFAMLGSTRGGKVQVTSPAFPGEAFPGEVLYTGDLVDDKSRTIKLLARAANTPDRKLKPGMFVDVEIRGSAGRPAALVPETAILTADESAQVFVRTGPERFEPRAVTLGVREGGKVAVRSGLAPGEEVVTSGAFKLKAERARLAGGGS